MGAPALSHGWAKSLLDSALQEEEDENRRKACRARVREKVSELAKVMGCCCDLDNWEPEVLTGHSHVCRIHKAAIEAVR